MTCFLLCFIIHTVRIVGFSELTQAHSRWLELCFLLYLIILKCIFGCFFLLIKTFFFYKNFFYFLVWFTWYHLPFFFGHVIYHFFFVILLNKISLFNLTRFINQIVTFSYLLKIHLWPLSNFFNKRLNCFFLDCER